MTGDPLEAQSNTGGEGVEKVPNIPEGLWLEKRWGRRERGIGWEKGQLKVACFLIRVTPFQAMYQCKGLS